MDEDDAVYRRAKDFFENHYKDRGMVKWQGYFLSDHTEDVRKNDTARAVARNQKAMPEMELDEITEKLFKAYANNLHVSVQERSKQGENFPPIIQGKVQGFDEQYIFIGNDRIELDNLLWCSIE
ncbi:hypothetical protein ESZ50_01300 [Weissella muntiaci]|uniref:DNA-directed RNA polymerase beta subunit n=1 Tax=Weissella muntiaci TaxID=2508881 RepID=A0A6C2C9U4_9LACO|nr:hypothetical protein [Weissella muntiaci]TYC50880.1 hypothetical protein ESZ50_01300 [Weissella muntiaci]